ncbi:MAG: FAD-dependent oxidoreductase [Chloroflexota bacterium]
MVNQFFPRLFTPGNIGRMTVKNRIVMPAMSGNFPTAVGEASETHAAYLAERARGGVGLIVVEHSNVDYPRGQGGAVQLRVDDDSFIPGLHDLVEAVRRWGARIALQINHVGGAARKTIDGPYAPSPFPLGPGSPVPKELSRAEIADIILKFGQAAMRTRKAGFDAVEIHGAHGYLIAEFLSPVTNKRTDEYGGDLNGRMKFALDVVGAVRRSAGSDFPIIFRLNADDFIPGGLTLADSKIIARALEKASVDALNITTGGPMAGECEARAVATEPMSYEQGWKIHLAAEIKKAVKIPIIAVSVIREPEFAESVLEQSKADFVGIGRGLIADPEWPLKASRGESGSIRKCISCNQACQWNRHRGWRMRCAINVVVGRERELSQLIPAQRAKRVCVVGGGPAGMECARIAARRGHSVVLYEKEEECGGQVRLACVPPGKDKLRWLTDYLTGELETARVEVRSGSEVGAKEIVDKGYDVVVVATGAMPAVPAGLAGKGRQAVTAHDVLSGRVMVEGQEVVVIGGGAVGCETATYLAKGNKKVTVIEMLPEAATDIPGTSRWDLLRKLNELGVPVRLNTRALEVRKDGVLVSVDGKQELLPATAVVFATGVKPVNGLASELEGKVPELYVIGDASLPGKITEAIYEGNVTGRRI